MLDPQVIYKKYEPSFKALNARIYSSSPNEDYLLLRWWLSLRESGDIQRLMTPDAHRFVSFCNVFSFPCSLIYSLSPSNEINSAAWYVPVDSTSKHRSCYSGLWLSPIARGSRRSLSFVILAYSLAFEFYQTILGFTWQKEILDLHMKLGYTIVGCIPNMYDKEFVYIVHLIKDDFIKSRLYKTAERNYQRALERS